MQKIFLNLILPAILVIPLSYKKTDDRKSATELMTQKTWTLTSYGYDINANGVIDVSEESIRDCDKDNKYSFNTDGTGLYEDNSLSCGNGISEIPFTWKFLKDETEIDFLTGIVKIVRLAENDLIIYNESTNPNGQSIKFLTIFRR